MYLSQNQRWRGATAYPLQAKSCTPATRRAGEREGNPSHSKERPAPKALRFGERMPQLYFTDLRALRRPAIVDSVSHELPFEIIATAATSGLVDGMPFILGDDGSYDHDLNRFFRACPTIGLRSLNSLRAYARDIVVWLRRSE